MTEGEHDDDGESSSRVFYDVAQLLASAENPEARVMSALGRLRSLVPYERCAVLEALPGRAPRLVTQAEMPLEERALLEARITALFGRLVGGHGRVPDAGASSGKHLAVPLVGLDEVVGVLFVYGGDCVYEERHVRALSVVAANLAAYFSLLQASALESQRARELEAAQRAAEIADRAKDEFLAVVSHELRTPLNTILAWADALRSKETREADRARAFDAIERSVRAETKLIDDLLDVSSIASATLRLDLRALEPSKLIEAALQALLPRARQKAIELEVVLDQSVASLVADPHRLNQIVVSLVANAIKFTPDGGRVEVRLQRAGVLARIQVIDTGLGIKPELLPRLFERFRQANGSSRRAHGGLGLGLSLVRDLVELHGGQVRAESPGEHQGATFTVDLPLVGAEPPAEPKVGAVERREERLLAGVHVLLVDDDRDICEVLQFVLEGQGAVVSVAFSAAEALAALERSTPHVLLSDIAMPGETGYDLMRKIVIRSGDAAPPAVALSAYAPGHDLREALESGFRMLLAKPIEPRKLIAAVAGLAGRTSVDDPARRAERTRS